jgi:hypothetical protein
MKFSVRHSILLNNIECSPLGVNEGVNFTPRGQISPLGARGDVKNGPLDIGDSRGQFFKRPGAKFEPIENIFRDFCA